MQKTRQDIIYSTKDGERHVSYTFDGNPVIHTEISNSFAELAKKYQFAIKELEVTQAYLEQIQSIILSHEESTENPTTKQEKTKREYIVIQGLFSAATISYGKLFMSVGQGRRKFAPRDFFNQDGSQFKDLHSWWMDMRNLYIAHSASESYDDARVVLLFEPIYAGPSKWFWCFPHVRFHRNPPIKTIVDLIYMVKFMFSIMLTKQEKLIQHIASNISEPTMAKHRLKAVYASPCNELPPSPPITI